jgi:mutator protein MutT
MGMSPYVKRIREAIGHDLLLCPAVTAVIRNAHGEVLLLKRRDDGKWDTPGGHIDPDETPAIAVERETLEETGLVVRATNLIGVIGGKVIEHRYPNNDLIQPLIVCFLCEVLGGNLNAVDGEASELRYFAQNVLPEMSTVYPQEILFPSNAQSPFFQRSSHQ